MKRDTTATTHTEAEVQRHIEALLKLGWKWQGRGLFPTWGKGDQIHVLFTSKHSPPLNDQESFNAQNHQSHLLDARSS